MNNQKCTITDDWSYKGMSVIFMENEYLRIGILAGRGSDIFEFRYKPRNLDFLLRLPKGIKNPVTEFTQIRDTSNQIEDYYYGGWQEMLPNSPAFNYRGAVLGQHGEVFLIPWKYAILSSSEEEVAVKLWTRPLRVPLLIEKTLSLKSGETKLRIEENLTNEANTHLDIMWGHHIAFGLPFLKEGATIETNAKTYTAEESMPPKRKFKSGKEFTWPTGEGVDGKECDGSIVPPEESEPYSELCYLKGFEKKAYYRIRNPKQNIGFGVTWNGDIFKCLWMWQERYATKDFPWWGNCYTVGLEPWTSALTSQPEEAIKKGDWLHLEPGEVVKAQLEADILL